MNARQRRTLDAIFERPTRADVVWSDVESLLRALGAELSEGRGSRVRVVLGERKAVFHRPHPQRTARKAMLDAVRTFLIEAGVNEP